MSNTSQASQRITALLDENSFVEIGAKVTARATDFNLKQTKTPSDGVITGYGVIDGNLVYVYSQDASVLGGSVGEMHARKIAGLYDLASKTGAPVIGLIDSTGLRLQEATDALNGFGEIYLYYPCGCRYWCSADHSSIWQLRRRSGTDSGTDRLYLYGKQKSKAVRKFPERYGRQLDREGRYLFCKIPE